MKMVTNDTENDLVISVSPHDIQQLMDDMHNNLTHAMQVISATMEQGQRLIIEAQHNINTQSLESEELTQEQSMSNISEEVVQYDDMAVNKQLNQITENAQNHIDSAEEAIMQSIGNIAGMVESQRAALEQQLIAQQNISEQIIENAEEDIHNEEYSSIK